MFATSFSPSSTYYAIHEAKKKLHTDLNNIVRDRER